MLAQEMLTGVQKRELLLQPHQRWKASLSLVPNEGIVLRSIYSSKAIGVNCCNKNCPWT